MLVSMVDIGDMGVRMRQWLMWMGVGMRFLTVPVEVVWMLMVVVMRMLVRMSHRSVGVRMVMLFRQVQPNSGRHQRAGKPESGFRCIA